jgi:PAS domain S-box-containing protein
MVVLLAARRGDGSEFPAVVIVAPVTKGINVRFYDVSSLHRSETRSRRLVDAAVQATVVCDAASRVRAIDSRMARFFGYRAPELVGRPLDVLVPSTPLMLRPGPGGGPHEGPPPSGQQSLEVVAHKRDGSGLKVELSCQPLQTDDGLLMVLAFREVAPVYESGRRLPSEGQRGPEADERWRMLLAFTRAEVEQRRRTAVAIQDETIQNITAASLRLEHIGRRMGDADNRALLVAVQDILRQSIDGLRYLLSELRPPDPDHLGFVAAVYDLLQHLRNVTGATVRLDNALSFELPAEARIVAYRLLHEALSNVRRYAQADDVRVELRARDRGVAIVVEDNGVGYDAVSLGAQAGHLGLTLVKERAEIAGGWCNVDAAPGRGVHVEFWLPLGEYRRHHSPEWAHPSAQQRK